MLSQKTRYTIRALQHLADNYRKGNVALKEIAETQNIPKKFLTIILSELVREGIVNSQSGPGGGYQIALNPVDISYGDIVRMTRGSLALVPCASRLAYERCEKCIEETECRTRALMLRVRDETAAVLDKVTFADSIDVLSGIGKID